MMRKVQNNRVVRNRRNSFVPTKVIGIRAEVEFWEKIKEQAKKENIKRNELVVRVLTEYCEGK